MTAPVFISHSQSDEAAYSSLCLALDGQHIPRWDVSTLAAGQHLSAALRDAIEKCETCIFLATRNSIQSRWCLAELGAFWGGGKKVIIYVADPEIDESELPPQFQGNIWTRNAGEVVSAIRDAGSTAIRKTSNGYCTDLGSMTVHVHLGRIENSIDDDATCLDALPANEYFDDECIHDANSALGAYMQHFFCDQIPAIDQLVADSLANRRTERVEKRPEQFADSFGVGQCVFLDRPLGSPKRIAMVAVTTQRANVGLHADPAFIFAAADSLCRVMANYRLARLRIPIIGSGHGGLKPEVSFVCMLIAFGALSHKPAGRHLRDLEIVVFRRDENAVPQISEDTIRRSLVFAHDYLSG